MSQILEVVKSGCVDLGEVDAAWCNVPVENKTVETKFETRLEAGELIVTHTGYREGAIKVESGVFGEAEMIDDDSLTEPLQSAVVAIDSLYRIFRGTSENTTLRHNIDARYGRARGLANISQAMTNCRLPVSGQSLRHFDGIQPDEDEVILNHRGTPTLIYHGPVLRFPRRLPGVLVFFHLPILPIARRVPHDHAIVIDSNTLHRQSAQVHLPRNRGGFLRDLITVQAAE